MPGHGGPHAPDTDYSRRFQKKSPEFLQGMLTDTVTQKKRNGAAVTDSAAPTATPS